MRRLVTAAVAGLGLDRLSARVGLARTLGPDGLSGLVGLLAYILILIPAVIGALEALGLEALTAPLTAMLTEFLAVIPLLFFAAVVLAISYVVARLVADLATAVPGGPRHRRAPGAAGAEPGGAGGGEAERSPVAAGRPADPAGHHDPGDHRGGATCSTSPRWRRC